MFRLHPCHPCRWLATLKGGGCTCLLFTYHPSARCANFKRTPK